MHMLVEGFSVFGIQVQYWMLIAAGIVAAGVTAAWYHLHSPERIRGSRRDIGRTRRSYPDFRARLGGDIRFGQRQATCTLHALSGTRPDLLFPVSAFKLDLWRYYSTST